MALNVLFKTDHRVSDLRNLCGVIGLLTAQRICGGSQFSGLKAVMVALRRGLPHID